jgi:ferredoxin
MRYFPNEKATFKCVACGACAKECPKQALEIVQKEEGV